MGQKFSVQSNHFICDLPTDINFFQYDVELEIFTQRFGWRPVKKEDRFMILKKILLRENFPLVWFDEGKCLYATTPLDLSKKEYEFQCQDQKLETNTLYRFIIKSLAKSYNIQVI